MSEDQQVQRTKYQVQSFLKLCLPLRYKRLIRFTVIRMLHADGLCLRFALEGCLQIHIEFAIEHLFRLAECEGWSTSQLLGKGSGCGRQFSCRYDAIV